jgi:hypothetical protein
MFKILLNGMWSKDYLTPLAKVMSDNMGCDLEEASQMIRELGEGKRQSMMAATMRKAEALACDLLQYGCYIEVEQVAPLTDAVLLEDLQEWFDEGQQDFRVLYHENGHVDKIIEERGYGYLRLESQAVSDWVGEELIRLGAQRLGPGDWPALKQRLEKAIAENEVRRQEIRAERAAEKRLREERGESVDGLDNEEE